MKKSQIKSDFFKIIDSEHKAYWLGFLYADGCNYAKRNCISICVSQTDYSHISKLRKTLNSECKPYFSPSRVKKFNGRHIESGPLVTIQFYNKELSLDLIKCGCIPRKTFLMAFPSFSIVPKSLIHHFMRGYFDGDGSIYRVGVKRNKTHKDYTFKVTSNKIFANSYSMILGNALDVVPRSAEKHKDSNVYSIVYRGNSRIKRIYDFLYKDATVFLERKKDRFLELIS